MIENLWFYEALTAIEAQTLWDYSNLAPGKDWISRLKSDLARGDSQILSQEKFNILFDMRVRLGPRIFFPPKFEVGDGAHLYCRGEASPVTVIHTDSRSATVGLDLVYLHGSQSLFVPRSAYAIEKQRVFTKRSDGTYQMLGTRGGDVVLRLGRVYRKRERYEQPYQR